MINWWPPFRFAGIRVTRFSTDFREVDVELRMAWWNRNYVGVHFGGSLYAMTDPFFMLMIMQNLGPDYIVWDKAAKIRFRKPGRGTVTAKFRITEQDLASIRHAVAGGDKTEPVFHVQVCNAEGNVVTEVEKTIYVKLKDKKP
ncbi:MAG: hypothetical protein RIQ81_1450 [Pseudomonadota bacterium]